MEIIDIKDSIVSEQIKTSIDEMVNAYCDELIKQDKEITRLNKVIETKDKRIKKLEENNKDLKALLKEYKYELGLQELENTSIVDLD